MPVYSFLQPTGKESLVEKWILHKLNVAAKELNESLTERNFMVATNAAYNFWLYELCDVYIVCSFQHFLNTLLKEVTGSYETNDR